MKKTIETLIDKTEDCLRKYADKQAWTPEDMIPLKNAISAYEKLLRLDADCEEAATEGVSMRKHYSMRSHCQYPERSPRYYEYDGSLTSYGHDGYHHDDMVMRAKTPRSMHSIDDKMIQKLEALMDEAQSEYERDKIREMISIARNRSN